MCDRGGREGRDWTVDVMGLGEGGIDGTSGSWYDGVTVEQLGFCWLGGVTLGCTRVVVKLGALR